ncbi:DUF4838 domain-containing protein [uncultured Chitinophaga sp.]|jgi:Beta-galactosidase|uniref:DUF4838 domain-containing protein n=1 Tax=uncultured Chitinophaga sp. TaxID=339340 RepID=UPI002621952B|nr:DUF4838 domain-containing protein [uncultured Chitinophaga sp.]
MRHLCTMLSILLMGCNSINGQNLALVQSNKSAYQIVIPAQASKVEQTAATELQKYFSKATGVQLPIKNEGQSASRNAIYIGGTKETKQKRITAGVTNDGFAIRARNGSLYIAGEMKRGTLYGVYSFLEKFLHINYYTPGAMNIPKTDNVTVPGNTDIVENPVFKIRDNFSSIAYDDLYMDWHKITHIMENKNTDWGLFGHSSFWLVPPATFYKQHPEYYSVVNGKRTPSQLCFSNKAIRQIIIDGLRKRMQQKPNAEYWMVGQEDEGIFCQCDQCQAAYKKYGAKSGLLLEAINDVAKVFPDKTIATFAFRETIQPPSNIKPAANVLIVYAPSKTTRELSFEKNPHNKIYADYMRQWGNLTNRNLFVWDYYANYQDVLAPYPNLQTFSENFRFYEKSGVKYVLAQGINQAGGDMKELKTFVLSKLLWKPNLNQDSLVNDFCNGFYGPASGAILNYINTMRTNLFKEKATLKLSADALAYSSSFLQSSYLRQYDEILQKAENAVSNNQVYLDRVRLARIPVDYIILKSFNAGSSTAGRMARTLFNSNQPRVSEAGINIDKVQERFSQRVKGAGIQYLKDSKQEPVTGFLQKMK